MVASTGEQNNEPHPFAQNTQNTRAIQKASAIQSGPNAHLELNKLLNRVLQQSEVTAEETKSLADFMARKLR